LKKLAYAVIKEATLFLKWSIREKKNASFFKILIINFNFQEH